MGIEIDVEDFRIKYTNSAGLFHYTTDGSKNKLASPTAARVLGFQKSSH